MGKFVVKMKSVFVGHGYVQNTGTGSKGDAAIRYHRYVIPEGVYLKDVVPFAYSNHLSRIPKTLNGH